MFMLGAPLFFRALKVCVLHQKCLVFSFAPSKQQESSVELTSDGKTGRELPATQVLGNFYRQYLNYS